MTSELFRDALGHLHAGGVVGMPTETVYGLAADARDADAVAKVFALKGRPSTNPLIVHVASAQIGERYAAFDDRAWRLFAAFAPGPLTIVLPRRQLPLRQAGGGTRAICDLVTAGLDTVGIRIPNHPLALELLRAFDGPLAAPSANVSNHVSPTTAAHVREAFADRVPVLDGGPCGVGIESTVLSLAGGRPVILRPGAVTREQIERVIGSVDVAAGHVSPDLAARSPGQFEKHYAPRTVAWRATRDAMLDLLRNTAGVIMFGEGARDELSFLAARLIELPADPDGAARLFYAALRELDACGADEIFVELPPDAPEWAALRDRIMRATRPIDERSGSP